jgi:carbonic anhydrase/acetyltransferase-like protein (isoleucine patch superfamily)
LEQGSNDEKNTTGTLREYNGKAPRLGNDVYVHDTALLVGDIEIGDLSSIWPQVVARGDVNWMRIGRETNVQDGCLLHVTDPDHPLEIGSRVTIGHGVILHGCTVRDNCLIGMGAIILDGAVVEEGSLVAAGSLVRMGQVIPAGSLAAGMPAEIKRKLKPEQSEEILRSAESYVKYAKSYM